eukprot:CAMPEP_0117674540 /NCGR_PEP_ID=MMETSP0804-20121206/15098_1 /TAXON_ID=1074897 /ORGANISM="Tetraselmis astigmatica, Strain CCMP880" /LENGTH=242 /DNA_ID=CAMNT_0005483427 /DNA_START=35 /DNA_END=763 /DNA_ORIENTATION=-
MATKDIDRPELIAEEAVVDSYNRALSSYISVHCQPPATEEGGADTGQGSTHVGCRSQECIVKGSECSDVSGEEEEDGEVSRHSGDRQDFSSLATAAASADSGRFPSGGQVPGSKELRLKVEAPPRQWGHASQHAPGRTQSHAQAHPFHQPFPQTPFPGSWGAAPPPPPMPPPFPPMPPKPPNLPTPPGPAAAAEAPGVANDEELADLCMAWYYAGFHSGKLAGRQAAAAEGCLACSQRHEGN